MKGKQRAKSKEQREKREERKEKSGFRIQGGWAGFKREKRGDGCLVGHGALRILLLLLSGLLSLSV